MHLLSRFTLVEYNKKGGLKFKLLDCFQIWRFSTPLIRWSFDEPIGLKKCYKVIWLPCTYFIHVKTCFGYLRCLAWYMSLSNINTLPFVLYRDNEAIYNNWRMNYLVTFIEFISLCDDIMVLGVNTVRFGFGYWPKSNRKPSRSVFRCPNRSVFGYFFGSVRFISEN